MQQVVIIVIFVFLGLLSILLDIVLVPGFILTLIGLGFLAAGVYYGQEFFGAAAGWGIALGSLAAVLAFVIMSFRLKLWRRLVLGDQQKRGRGLEEDPLASFKGKTGVCTSDLRPAGWIEIEGTKHRAVTQGQFFSKGQAIEITDYSTGQFVVELKKD